MKVMLDEAAAHAKPSSKVFRCDHDMEPLSNHHEKYHCANSDLVPHALYVHYNICTNILS